MHFGREIGRLSLRLFYGGTTRAKETAPAQKSLTLIQQKYTLYE